MDQQLIIQLNSIILDIRHTYHQLILLVGSARSGKTNALNYLAIQSNCSVINLNLWLSKSLINMPEAKRALRVGNVIQQLADQNNGTILLLDNTEILFDKSLKQDPLRLLQGLSRNRTVVASWNGHYKNNELTYAEMGHPEYRVYHNVGTHIVSMASV